MNNVHSVYIHIPFCKTICSYCDFCKMFYNEQLVDKYLISLKKEITNNYKGELITTIYIGGGSPSSLNLEQLKKLKEIIAIFKLDKSNEFTIEVNVNDVTLDKLLMYKDHYVLVSKNTGVLYDADTIPSLHVGVLSSSSELVQKYYSASAESFTAYST